MKTFWKIFIVAVLLIATFVTSLVFGNSINNWFDRTFISKDSKVVGEWSIDKLEFATEEDSFSLTKEECEEFITNFDETKATDLEKAMYSATNLFSNNFEFKEDGTLEATDGEETAVYKWTFEKGVVSVETEDGQNSFEANYKNKQIVISIELEDITMTQTLKKVAK